MTKGIIDRFRSPPMARQRPRADVRRRHLHDGHPRRADALRTGRRLAGALERGRLRARRAADAVLHVRDGLVSLLGLLAPTVETVQQLGFLIVLPTFLSNAFVPTETLPDVLQPIAEWNLISVLTQATRELFGNPSPSRPPRSRASIRSCCRCSGRSRSSPCSRARGAQVPRHRPLGGRVTQHARRHGPRPDARARADPRHGAPVRARRAGRPVAEELDREPLPVERL